MNYKRLAECEMGGIAKERDGLTGLPNRTYMEHFSTNLLNLARERRLPFTFYLIDIDHFKRINDVYSHDEGDQVLKNVGETLDSLLYDEKTASRWGGEEFAVVALTSKEGARSFADEIVNSLSRCEAAANCLRSNGDAEDITVSIGYSTFTPEDGLIEENGRSARSTILKNIRGKADRALFYSKFNGRNQANEFTPELNAAWTEAKTFRRYMASLIEQYNDHGRLMDAETYPTGLEHIDFDGEMTLYHHDLDGERMERWTDVGNLVADSLTTIINQGKTKDTRAIFDESDRIYHLIKESDQTYLSFSPEDQPLSGVIQTK